jgi:hypothetical protein
MPAEDRGSRYLAEWYMPSTRGPAISEVAQSVRRALAELPGAAHPAELLYALAVPQDAYAFGVFTADSADAVALVCEQIGHPADRVSAAVDGLDDQNASDR